METAVVGETPNLAARLQALAQPNQIVVSAATRAMLGDHFDLEDLGASELKGFAEPMPAWRVLKRCDDIAQIFGVHPGGECRRSHQVAKHHGQLAALGLAWRRCGRRHRCRCRCQGWGWRRGAERGDGGKELATMADRGHADGRSGPQPSGPAGRLRRLRCRGTSARIEQDRAAVANSRHRSPSQVPFIRETQHRPLAPRPQ
jgi:Adenylate and Guanylate cyclase catalytic domain